METGAIASRLRRLRADPALALPVVALIGGQVMMVLAYVARPDVNPSLVPVYPHVWIDVALLAVLTTTVPAATRRRRLLGLAIAGGYFVLLAYVGGLVGAGAGQIPLQVKWSLPVGYSPMLLYDGPALYLAVMPYRLVGYLALAYLVYVTVLDAAGAAFSGVIGLFSCVSCTWPILGTVVAGVFGGSSAVAAVASTQALGISTLVFLSAVALLWWRPTIGGRRRD